MTAAAKRKNSFAANGCAGNRGIRFFRKKEMAGATFLGRESSKLQGPLYAAATNVPVRCFVRFVGRLFVKNRVEYTAFLC